MGKDGAQELEIPNISFFAIAGPSEGAITPCFLIAGSQKRGSLLQEIISALHLPVDDGLPVVLSEEDNGQVLLDLPGLLKGQHLKRQGGVEVVRRPQ